MTDIQDTPLTDSAADFVTPNHKVSKESRLRKLVSESRERKQEKTKKPVPPMPRNLGKSIAELYALVGMGLMPFDPTCATAVMECAESCGEAWESLARNNPAVRRVLLSLVTTSDWSKVILANAPILMCVATHHIPSLQQTMAKAFAQQVEDNLKQETEKPAEEPPQEDAA